MSDEIVPAYKGELMLAGWVQNHTGGAKVTFMLPDDDALDAFRHMTVRKGNHAGQRFMAVLVQIGDDEQPINPEQAETSAPHPLTRSAGILCNEEDFQAFVADRRGFTPDAPKERCEQAAAYVREFCEVSSRAMLDSVPAAAKRFALLMADYRAFLHHGPI